MSGGDTPHSLRWRSEDGTRIDEIYDAWASSYDAELKEQAGYCVPDVAVEVLSQFGGPGDEVLDAGVGTGLVGERLRALAYSRLTGIDISNRMLALAQAKGIYRALSRQTLGEPLEFPSAFFDAVICVCVLGPTHAPAHTFDQLIRVTKPGGHVVFTLRADETAPGTDFGRRLRDCPGWTRVAERGPFVGFPTGERSELQFYVWAFRVGPEIRDC